MSIIRSNRKFGIKYIRISEQSLDIKGHDLLIYLLTNPGNSTWTTCKKVRVLISILIALTANSLCDQSIAFAAGDKSNKPAHRYEMKKASQHGSGKFYMGREIANIMGHRAAAWLNRPDREKKERTDLVAKHLNLKPTDRIADIGAGSGYFTFLLSPFVPKGKIFAVDIQREMLDLIRTKSKKMKIKNIVPVLGNIQNPKLKENSIDLAFMVDAYHEFSHPYEMMLGIQKALKPGGRLILLEYRGEDPKVRIKKLHKMTLQQAKKEMLAVNLNYVKTKSFLPKQHFMIFRKPTIKK